jgi:hypothetical protein
MSVGRFAPDEDNINQYNSLAQVTGPTQQGQAAAAQSPFSINPWTPDYTGEQTAESRIQGYLDPMFQAGDMFNRQFGHNDLTNPFFNRFFNQLAPGIGTIYDLLGSGDNDKMSEGFGDYMGSWLSALNSPGFGGLPGVSDVNSLFKQVLTGTTGNSKVAEFLQGATDRDIMSTLGDILQSAGYTALSPMAAKGMQNMMQQMMADWRSAGGNYGPETSGNAFMNFVTGSGWLDRLTR